MYISATLFPAHVILHHQKRGIKPHLQHISPLVRLLRAHVI
ncbi:hypothetical protein P20495_3530 [Pseudoalteromonas sp. BSi20495]|nr:hypothetical protein P20495_3530 [Pseudoalteromonas sp. BSi20495]